MESRSTGESSPDAEGDEFKDRVRGGAVPRQRQPPEAPPPLSQTTPLPSDPGSDGLVGKALPQPGKYILFSTTPEHVSTFKVKPRFSLNRRVLVGGGGGGVDRVSSSLSS
eukprot:CAMPEP_0171835454 /NCGR_PEP_ID=MMETSP0992-20121227/11004_1 /TAXON_ID=483369 /ORGANISM="non described non described, Strain CCMP2098" /LENGTH=109 /DNA_ID=CAMNT_0012451303 /DNA_START=399 /DNA_END=723 /DNA_ORIENTATION=-